MSVYIQESSEVEKLLVVIFLVIDCIAESKYETRDKFSNVSPKRSRKST